MLLSVSEANWDTFYQALNRKTGLDLHAYKQPQMRRRILGFAENLKLSNLEELWAWMIANPENLDAFRDRMAINVTELFRNPERWVDLEQRILPELVNHNPRLNIWSAGCSYGAEAHSLAMILDKRFPGGHRILCSDIDRAALKQAQQGIFNDADVKPVPEAYRGYLTPHGRGEWQASEKLRRYMRFQEHNLLKDRFESNLDLIVCRNVVIYFTEETKDELYDRFFKALRPGGILFVGGTERIFSATKIGYETAAPFFYRKPNEASRKWQNAS